MSLLFSELEPCEETKYRLRQPYRDRFELLLSEFEKMDSGFLYMKSWVDFRWPSLDDSNVAFTVTALKARRRRRLKAARKNPCGTACCIAGKAGLLPSFNELGFSWSPDLISEHLISEQLASDFTIQPSEFFGRVVTHGLLSNVWAVHNIHIPQQAVIVMRHMLESWGEIYYTGYNWVPSAEVRYACWELNPSRVKKFPVSKFTCDLDGIQA